MTLRTYDAIVLFSGGLDSLLSAKILQKQGLVVKCLHFTSPFFGKPDRLEHWSDVYDLDIEAVDVGKLFIQMLHTGPEHGFGKTLNPCVDCKILMLRQARALMARYGAGVIATGEVLGQRPMSQRRDTLDRIRHGSGLEDHLLRPLSAALLPPVAAERQGVVDRARLYGFAGRGRAAQLRLAADYGIREVPTPAGGCRLTERENACRYWPLLRHAPEAGPAEFRLANTGRQFWVATPEGNFWLCVGRNAADNEALERQAREGDIRFYLRDMPGPLGLARPLGSWPDYVVEDAARLTASFSPRASLAGQAAVGVHSHGNERLLHVVLNRSPALPWGIPAWEETREAIRAKTRTSGF